MFRVSDRRILRKSEIFMKILIYKQKKWWYYNFNETKRNEILQGGQRKHEKSNEKSYEKTPGTSFGSAYRNAGPKRLRAL